MSKDGGGIYPNDVYQLAFDNFPDVYSDRLRDLLLTSTNPQYWVFDGAKNERLRAGRTERAKPATMTSLRTCSTTKTCALCKQACATPT